MVYLRHSFDGAALLGTRVQREVVFGARLHEELGGLPGGVVLPAAVGSARPAALRSAHESAVHHASARLCDDLQRGRVVRVDRGGAVEGDVRLVGEPGDRDGGVVLERTVLDHFGVDAAFACAVDLLEEDAVEQGADLRAGMGGVDPDDARGLLCGCIRGG